MFCTRPEIEKRNGCEVVITFQDAQSAENMMEWLWMEPFGEAYDNAETESK